MLHDPHGTWVRGDIEMQDPPSVMTDDKEAVNHAERDRWDREEVHCSDRFAMVPKEREPAFAGSGSFGARRIQRETVLSETWKPSMSSSP
ncbi:MAG TPA: hypothetical protein VJR04_15220 [Terriglobales bacterium]|nr:hypothetical protein [Terriglobales bacterium]